MPKLSYLLLPGALAIGLFFIVSGFDDRESDSSETSTAIAENFVAFAEGISTARYSDNGEIQYTLHAERQVQFEDNTSELTSPLIRLFSGSDSQWNIVAESGRISAPEIEQNEESRSIALSGNVEVYSLDDFGNRLLLTTDYLELMPETETAATDSAVQLQTTNISHSASGMIARLGRNEITFLGNSEGRYSTVND